MALSAELTATGSADLTVSDGGLDHEYIFDHLDFHWGEDDTEGSEHTVDGVHYPLEVSFP